MEGIQTTYQEPNTQKTQHRNRTQQLQYSEQRLEQPEQSPTASENQSPNSD